LNELNARSVGVLIALFERAVGLYAELIDVNAYDQPGVEAGKKAGDRILDLQKKVLLYLRAHSNAGNTVEAIAEAIGEPDAAEMILHIIDHAAANPDHGVMRAPGTRPLDARYRAS